MIRVAIQALLLVFPWGLRRLALEGLFGFTIHRTARIGMSIVAALRLEMHAHSRIGHLTYAKGLSSILLQEHSRIGNLNWITGFPKVESKHFGHVSNREPCLILQEHAAVTHRHLIDCTHAVRIGPFSTVAGWGTQILTHSIDLYANRQDAAPIEVGAYCFVGTRSILLKGSALPDHSVLAAGSTLSEKHSEPRMLYGGVPAKAIKAISRDALYFSRPSGHVT